MIIKRWARCEAFNPTSSKQLLAYYAWKGYPIRKNRKTKRPTTNEEALEATLSKIDDPLLRKALDARKLKRGGGDLKDTYLGADGRFHSNFTLEPDTGRLSSRAPNLQNVPNPDRAEKESIEERIALLIRSTIEADPGMVLMEFDWKAIEALLTGWFADDPGYMRLSELDSHAFYTSHILADRAILQEGFDALDPDLEAKLAWLKKTYPLERAEGKAANLALGYGMQADHLAARLKIPRDRAARLIRIKDEMAPKVTAWKNATQRRAHEEGKLVNPFGFCRSFFEVYRKTKYGELRPGREANEALSFLPQSTGAAMLRTVLVDLDEEVDETGLAELLVPVHDSVLLQCRPEKVEDVKERVVRSMNRPWPELNGLQVGVSVKMGLNWAEAA
jgi:DNA polymerase-1